jgi:sigma-B regulation protein RsbU (phosphoserine phosphatase)
VTESAPAAASRLAGLWKILEEPLRDPDPPLALRLARAAVSWTGARRAALYVREKGAWVRAAVAGSGDGEPDPPDFSVSGGDRARGDTLWIPLAAEGEVHGHLGLEGVGAEEGAELAPFLGLVLGSVLGANRFSRQFKEADFEIRTRLVELESLYDLGLSLSGQLDVAALADEVLFRSISLTDAGKGTLVLFHEDGRVLLERSLGGQLLPGDQLADWQLPDGEAVINNAAASVPTSGMRLSSCRKCLAVPISVSGRRLGVLAVADKESRDGGVLDFTAADARLLSLFANQAAAAIETARLHRAAIEQERIERELELAAAIQREILPRSLPEVEGAEIAAASLPTRQVGGDYYDVIPLPGGRLAFLVADVSGKGIPAALLVSTVHAAVHLQIDEAKTVADLVTRIDRHLRRYAATRKFLTLFFGLFEPRSGVLTYVSAGHNPGLLLRATGGTETLGATGVPVGMFPDASWKEESVTLSPGDLLCVYTDGLTEAVNVREEEFGLERLSAALASGRQEPAGQLCERILGEIADFARDMPQYDDQTLLLLRRRER